MSNAARGISWMLISGILFVGVTAFVRHLGSDMNAVQAACIRYAFGTALFLPLYIKLIARRVYPARMGAHLARGLVHGIGVMLWFYAMAQIPIAEVTAIGFLAPIFVTVGAAVFLGERLQLRRITAVGVGFVGALVILRPGVGSMEAGAIAMLVAAPLFAISILIGKQLSLIGKQLSRVESSAGIVAYLSLFVTVVLIGPAIAVWRTPTPDELIWLFATALIATAGHYTLTHALTFAELSLLQPFTFLQLVWAALIGYFIFAETPDVWTMFGGTIIVGSATYIAHREAQLRRVGRQE